MKLLKTETIEELIDRLRGTCNESYDFDDYSMEELQQLDDEIFQCVRCGWWCEISELSEYADDELFCTDHDEEEE